MSDQPSLVLFECTRLHARITEFGCQKYREGTQTEDAMGSVRNNPVACVGCPRNPNAELPPAPSRNRLPTVDNQVVMLVREQYLLGSTHSDLATKFRLSKTAIQRVCKGLERKNNSRLTAAKRDDLRRKIRANADAVLGSSLRQIASDYGVSIRTISRTLKAMYGDSLYHMRRNARAAAGILETAQKDANAVRNRARRESVTLTVRSILEKRPGATICELAKECQSSIRTVASILRAEYGSTHAIDRILPLVREACEADSQLSSTDLALKLGVSRTLVLHSLCRLYGKQIERTAPKPKKVARLVRQVNESKEKYNRIRKEMHEAWVKQPELRCKQMAERFNTCYKFALDAMNLLYGREKAAQIRHAQTRELLHKKVLEQQALLKWAKENYNVQTPSTYQVHPIACGA